MFCYFNFFRVGHDIPNKDRFLGFSKLCYCPQQPGWPASWCRVAGNSEFKHGVSQHLRANRISLPQAGMRQRDYPFLFLFTVLGHCKSVSHSHSYGNLVILPNTSSLPPAVNFLLWQRLEPHQTGATFKFGWN